MRSIIGFVMALIGVAGLAEGQLISLLPLGIGAILMWRGYEEEVDKCSTLNSNVLDRLYFLCQK